MTLSRQEVEDWATAYIEAETLPSEAKHGSPFWWSIERFMNLFELSEAEDAWVVILEVLARKPSQQIIGVLAAGPLEDLIEGCRWSPSAIGQLLPVVISIQLPFRWPLHSVSGGFPSTKWHNTNIRDSIVVLSRDTCGQPILP